MNFRGLRILSTYLTLGSTLVLSLSSTHANMKGSLGNLENLPPEIRFRIYDHLDHRALGNLELTSKKIDQEIEEGRKWQEQAQLLGIKPPDAPSEANYKIAIRIAVTQRAVERIIAQPQDHGLLTCNLFLVSQNFSGCHLQYVNLSAANLDYVKLGFAFLGGADLSFANLRNAVLGYTDLNGTNFLGANLQHAQLTEAKLIGAQMMAANLHHARLGNADLSGADLREAQFIRANLRGAKNLQSAKLRGADFRGADLRNTGVTRDFLDQVGSYYDCKTRFSYHKWIDRVTCGFWSQSLGQ